MDLTLQCKACCACAKAKRRCGREIPTCGRCQSRGIRCDYPTAAESSLPPPPQHEDGLCLAGGQQPLSGVAASATAPAVVLDALVLDTGTLFGLSGDDHVIHIDDLFSPSSVANLNPKSSAPPLPWYLEPSSFEIDHLVQPGYDWLFCSSVFDSFIEDIKSWLAAWVNTGTCPFIHGRVYIYQIPRCVQDAYTILSTYQNKTPENKGIIARLVEERIKQLLSDQPTLNTSEAQRDGPWSALTPFEHLARVHALLIYQMIGLYDGDIRLRHVAETQIPTLNAWLQQLTQSAQSASREGAEKFISSLLSPPRRHSTTGGNFGTEADTSNPADSTLSPEDTAWHAWLFAETIRRTWLAACGVQTIYLTIQVRWAPCPGGLPCTMREGLWSAPSAFVWSLKCEGWEKQAGAGAPDFVRRDQYHRIFEQRRPEEVDEFATRALEMTWGPERVERWRFVMGAKG